VIAKAYQVLSNSTERMKYKRMQEDYKAKGLLHLLDLWDLINKDSSDSDLNKPDAFTKELYKAATLLVHNLL
jgi:curved DNA-binding protein CbpA